MRPTDVWPNADLLTSYFKTILDEGVPKYVQDLYKQCWLHLNTVLPRSLWVMTINALLPKENHVVFLTQENIAVDPLQVLRCDQRIFRYDEFLNATVLSLLAHFFKMRHLF